MERCTRWFLKFRVSCPSTGRHGRKRLEITLFPLYWNLPLRSHLANHRTDQGHRRIDPSYRRQRHFLSTAPNESSPLSTARKSFSVRLRPIICRRSVILLLFARSIIFMLHSIHKYFLFAFQITRFIANDGRMNLKKGLAPFLT